MGDKSRSTKPKMAKKTIVTALVAFLVVMVLISTFLSTSSSKNNEGRIKSNLVSGLASDFIINQTDMGANWNASTILINVSEMAGDRFSQNMTSAAGVFFDQFNSTGQLEYRVQVGLIVFNTIDNASAYYNMTTKIGTDPDTSRILLENVSIGNGGVILDGPHITLGHEAKAIHFTDRNVFCQIVYHHSTTYETLPNSLLTDLAAKQDARFP